MKEIKDFVDMMELYPDDEALVFIFKSLRYKALKALIEDKPKQEEPEGEFIPGASWQVGDGSPKLDPVKKQTFARWFEDRVDTPDILTNYQMTLLISEYLEQ